MPAFRQVESRISKVVFDHLGDRTTYYRKAGGSVTTRVIVYGKPQVVKDDSVRGLAAATSRQINAAETEMMASISADDVPSPQRGDWFMDAGAKFVVEHVAEWTPSRYEVVVRRVNL